MLNSGPFVTSAVLAGLETFLKARGTTFADVVAGAKLSHDEVVPSDHKEIPLEHVVAILNAAAVLTNSPCFGAEWAESYPRGATGAFGYLLMNAATVEEALRVTVRYLSLVIHPVAIELVFEDHAAVLSWRLSAGLQGRATQYALFAAGATICGLRRVAGGDWNPEIVELPGPELPCRALLRRVMGPTVVFDCVRTRIVIGIDSLGRRNEFADPQLFALIRELGDRMLKERATETPLAQVVRQAISRRLGTSDVSLETIAEVLDLAPRTLQSRLAAEETSFEAVLQLTRQRLAESYLRDTNLPLTEIALLLGFSELSAFTRASLRWFKKPPSALRQHLRLADNAPSH